MDFLRLYGRVLRELGSERWLGWFLALANVALASAQFAEPILFGRIVDVLTGIQASRSDAALGTLAVLLGAWIGFALFSIVAGTLIALHADRLSHRRRQAVLTDYFEHVLQLPLAYHSGTHSGRLMKVMLQGTDALWALWLGFFREHMSAFVSLAVLLPLSLVLNWRLGLLLLALCAAFAALAALLVRKTGKMQSEVERYYTDLAERASDTLGNIALVQSFARIEAEVSGLRSVTERLLAAQIPVLSWWALATVLTRAGTTITILAIIVTGTWLSLHGLATIGEMVTFMNFAIMVIGRMESTIGFVNRLAWDAPRLREFFEVLDTTPSLRDRADAIDIGRATGEVEFRDVSFAYDDRMPAVEGLSFTARPGEVIALVGPTGAGKSTSLALLHRAFDPAGGAIFLDGVDLRDIKLGALRRNIGVVFQEALLFNRSIADNLLAGKPDATDEEMRSAAQRAQALDFIDRAPDGLNARVGERGRMLSGGERQRLSIARALLKDPPVLILDEATSALDAETEAKVLAALDEVMKHRTTFVIAHRLATVRKATRILVFERGRVIESGSFDELFARNGAFAALARAQFMTANAAE